MAIFSHYKYSLTGFLGKIIDTQNVVGGFSQNREKINKKTVLSIEKSGSVEGAPQ